MPEFKVNAFCVSGFNSHLDIHILESLTIVFGITLEFLEEAFTEVLRVYKT